MKKIGLALGGGGVRGLAHISVLEILDDLDCKPSVIAGTSTGAIIGAFYASGMSGKDIKKLVRKIDQSPIQPGNSTPRATKTALARL